MSNFKTVKEIELARDFALGKITKLNKKQESILKSIGIGATVISTLTVASTATATSLATSALFSTLTLTATTTTTTVLAPALIVVAPIGCCILYKKYKNSEGKKRRALEEALKAILTKYNNDLEKAKKYKEMYEEEVKKNNVKDDIISNLVKKMNEMKAKVNADEKIISLVVEDLNEYNGGAIYE